MAKFIFEAALVRPEGIGTWTYLDIPLEVTQKLGTRGQIKVIGTINGHPFRTSARPHGDGSHYIVVNRSIRDAIQAIPGDVVHVEMDRDTAPRTVDVPADFITAIEADQKLRKSFDSLSYSHKKEFVDWIESAKKMETRDRRIANSVEMLRQGSSPKNPKK